MRVGIVALLQESNTFLSARTELRDFADDVLLSGEGVRDRFEGGHHEVSGFFAELTSRGVEAVPIFAARALPYGTIAAAAWDGLMRAMFDAFEKAGRCDGYLAAAHGATVSENQRDADGYWLSELRKRVGRETPIIATLDLHANLSARMVSVTDAIVAYRTNPHVDQLDCGRRAASLLLRTLRNEILPTQAAAFPPVVINIERQDTSMSPCRELFEQADKSLEHLGVLSNAILLGFPYADVAEVGSSTLVVTDNDPALAQRLANDMATDIWAIRRQFVPELLSMEVTIKRAVGLEKPVCLLDMGDNVGGGGPADSTWLLHALGKPRIRQALVCLCDPDAVARCESAGAGATTRMPIGGRSGPLHGPPFESTFTVQSLHDGTFREREPRHGGYSTFDQGRSAVVRSEHGPTVLLTSRRMAPFSLAQLTSCGLDPSAFDILVAKGVIAPTAAYRSVCRHFLRVNTPGVTTADLGLLSYGHRRKPLYPFETEFDWQPQIQG